MTTIDTQESPATPQPAEEIAGRLFGAAVAAMELSCVYLGDRLGLYRALAADSPQTAARLAAGTGLDERYVREWLQQQATAGLLTVDGEDVANAAFALAPGAQEALVEETSPAHVAALGRLGAAVGRVLPQLLDAYRTGAGVPYAAYGPDAVSAQAALNRPGYVHQLAAGWLPAMPDVAARLAAGERPARVADLGCGAGWAGIELAKAFPHAVVEGFDNDAVSIETARGNAAAEGVGDRVTFQRHDLARPLPGRFDLAMFMECVHDLPRPVEALRNARLALAGAGAVLVMDERSAEHLTAPGDDVERLFAAASALWCLPQGRVGPDPEPVGTLMRPSDLRRLAALAGYRDVEILDIEHPTFRFYRLHP